VTQSATSPDAAPTMAARTLAGLSATSCNSARRGSGDRSRWRTRSATWSSRVAGSARSSAARGSPSHRRCPGRWPHSWRCGSACKPAPLARRRWPSGRRARVPAGRHGGGYVHQVPGLAVVHEIFLGVGPAVLAIIAIDAYKLARTTRADLDVPCRRGVPLGECSGSTRGRGASPDPRSAASPSVTSQNPQSPSYRTIKLSTWTWR
jgi:hypothetical protein